MRGGSAILSACSACAGDYEDPDWTAPHDDASEEPAGHADYSAGAERGGPGRREGFLGRPGIARECAGRIRVALDCEGNPKRAWRAPRDVACEVRLTGDER